MFIVNIIEVTDEQKPYEQEWRKLHDEQHTQENPSHGYVRAPGMRTVPVERKVLTQTVEKLDLVAVIKAINGIAS